MRRTPLILATLLGGFIIAPVTFAQITGIDLGGGITDYQGPGYSATQVPLSPTQGVIISPYDTMPYTVIPLPSTSAPSYGATRFDPTPLPTVTPPASLTPAPTMPSPVYLQPLPY